MINRDILKNIDKRASMIGQPSFSEDIYDLDQAMWGFIRHRKSEGDLIHLTDLNVLAEIANASDEELKMLCSGVTLSFSPNVSIESLNRAFEQHLYRLKYPSKEVVNFVNSYWVTLKYTANEKGIETTSLIFGLPVDVVSVVSKYSFRKVAALSTALELRFELRYQPDLIATLIGRNTQGLVNIPAIMNRLQQMVKVSGALR